MLREALLLLMLVGSMMTTPISLLTQEVFKRGEEVFFKKASGEIIQLTNDGKKKYEILLSPGAQWVIYRGEPLRDRAMLGLDITVIDVQDPASKKDVHLDLALQSLISMEWLNEHYFALVGETNSKNDSYAILDPKMGGVIAELVGCGFHLSPDRLALAYRSFIPRGAPTEFNSHYIELFDLRDREPAPRHEGRRYAQVLYPDHDPDKPFDNLDERHFVRSNLAWSPDSRSIAFVENHQRTLSVLVLDLRQGAGGIKVSNVRKFELTKEGERRLLWEERIVWEGTNVLVVTGDKYLWDEVNQMTRKGPKVEWRINLTNGSVSMVEVGQP